MPKSEDLLKSAQELIKTVFNLRSLENETRCNLQDAIDLIEEAVRKIAEEREGSSQVSPPEGRQRPTNADSAKAKIENGVKFLGRALGMVRQARGIVAAESVKPVVEDTGLHHIPSWPKNPFQLFREWHGEQASYQHQIAANVLCLSTSTKSGVVSSRSLILRRLDEDGFVIMTDNRSKKSKQLAENPFAAMTFLWLKETDGSLLSRQVRAEGEVKILAEREWGDIYDNEPLFCKIRALVCHQGQPVDWHQLKEHHDSLLAAWQKGETNFPKPQHVVAYKMFPKMIEFYETNGPRIADRVMFLKNDDGWASERIAA